MDFSQFGRVTAAMEKTLSYYFNVTGPQMVTRETLRFIDNNFRLQGWQGASFQPWHPIKRQGTILVKTGALKRSFNSLNRGNGEVYFYSNMPYARAHNEGFSGAINVRAHKRYKYGKVKVTSIRTHKERNVKGIIGNGDVIGHTRNANIIQRQFAPTESNESPVLIEAIKKELETAIRNILTF